jgi:hypothetical protein|tara:strand:+ start:334 stop:531 length:198 start_codon:yes stop_codon:yes gene_type:complete
VSADCLNWDSWRPDQLGNATTTDELVIEDRVNKIADFQFRWLASHVKLKLRARAIIEHIDSSLTA